MTPRTQAAAWYQKAAEQGDAEAQDRLALSYASGQGVPKDDARAVAWSSKAAKQGHPGAQFELGLWYARGQGVAQDDAQAVAWLRKAAEQGLPVAQYQLGSWYAAGRHVRQDYVEALKWLNLAATRTALATQKSYSEIRDGVAQKMSARQIAESQNRASEWLAAFEKRKK